MSKPDADKRNNKGDCQIIQDLIPLYVENICSESSRKLVEDHVSACEECGKILKESQDCTGMGLPDVAETALTLAKEAVSTDGELKKDNKGLEAEKEVFDTISRKLMRNAFLKNLKYIIIAACACVAVLIILFAPIINVSFEDSDIKTKYQVRDGLEMVWIDWNIQKWRKFTEGDTLVIQGKSSIRCMWDLAKSKQCYRTSYYLEDGIDKIVYRDGQGDHVVWEPWVCEADVTYRMAGDAMVENEEQMFMPCILLDRENKTFTFSYDFLSSYLSAGNYEIKDGILKAITNDGEYTYLFEVVDGETLKFIAEGSSEVRQFDTRLQAPVEDGAVFSLSE